MTEHIPSPNWQQKADAISFNSSAFVSGDYLASTNKESFSTYNPATEKPLAVFADAQ